jgi:hypothetical protein
VALRWRLEMRQLRWSPERMAGLALAVPALALLSLFGTVVIYVGVRALSATRPDLVLPVASAAATGMGLFWLLSPLLTGIALSETHDVTRLLHFPIPARVLAASSLLANLSQPAVLAKLPVVAGTALALSPRPARWPLTLLGVALSFAFILAADQVTTLALHGLSRRRRTRDLALFLGLGLGFVLSLLPLALFAAGAGPLRVLKRAFLDGDVFAWSPFAWGVRAAVHAGRGEVVGFTGHALAAAVAVGAALVVAALLLHRIHRGDVDLGGPEAGQEGTAARMPLPGALGALVEKDLRMSWRDPALKATLFISLAGPLIFLFFLWQARGPHGFGRGLLMLAAFVGASSIGGNAFGLERRGIALLMSLPVERWRILVAKNGVGLVLRLPGLVMLAVAGALVAPGLLPAVLTAAVVAAVIAAAADNYYSILFPVSVPEPGRSMSGGRRGLGAAALGALLFLLSLVVASPFLFLAWLPLLLQQPAWWLATLPLALAGAIAVYAMLVAGAARLLERREPELLERILAGARSEG